MSKVELTNMCMVYDEVNGKVLVQDRIKSWKGVAFPGGHLEDGESIVDSTIREIKEETGLSISDLELCGVVYWFNDRTFDKYLVFCFRTSVYSGQLLDKTDEGRLYWVDRNILPTLPLAEGFKERLPLFLDNRYSEGFGIWNETNKGELRWK
jgi:8-oxo-dGTP diphosphatase